jgi:hypothetical protein
VPSQIYEFLYGTMSEYRQNDRSYLPSELTIFGVRFQVLEAQPRGLLRVASGRTCLNLSSQQG